MIPTILFMLNHNEEYLKEYRKGNSWNNPIQNQMGHVVEEEKNRVLESFSFWNQFICILLLSRSHLNFFVCFPSLHSPLLPPCILPPALRPPPHQKKTRKTFFIILLSLQLLYFMYYSMYALIYIIIPTYYIIIYYCFIIIQLIFNIIFLCMILPAWGTLDCEKLDICFLPQKGPSFLCIYSSVFFL